MKTTVQTKEMREAILDATDGFLARDGYKKMTIDSLAQQVGIGKGSVYLHFTSKEDIALSHIDRIIERLAKELKIIAGKKISPEEKLRQMLVKRVLHRFDSVQHYSQNLNDMLSALRPKLLARRSAYFRTETGIFANVIEEGKKGGVFNAENSTEIAEIFLLATNSLLPFNLTTVELGERAEIEGKTLRLANLLLKGLVKN